MARADVALITAIALAARADLKFIGRCGSLVLRVPVEHHL